MDGLRIEQKSGNRAEIKHSHSQVYLFLPPHVFNNLTPRLAYLCEKKKKGEPPSTPSSPGGPDGPGGHFCGSIPQSITTSVCRTTA